MVNIQEIIDNHNIGLDDLWKEEGQIKLLSLIEDCMCQTVVSCIEQKVEGKLLLDVVDSIQKQIIELKNQESLPPQPEPWDK